MDIQTIIRILERAFLPCHVQFNTEESGILFFTLKMAPVEKQWSLTAPTGCRIGRVWRYGDTYNFTLELDVSAFVLEIPQENHKQ